MAIGLPYIFSIDKEAWLTEVEELESYFSQFGSRLPKEIQGELDSLRKRLT